MSLATFACTCRDDDEIHEPTCPQDLAIRWHTEIGSSIHATPLITDLYSDGRKDIIVPGFHRRLHLLDGRTGGEDPLFDAEHRSSSHATPLLFDIDFDGVQDIVLATYAGDVQFYKDTGSQAAYRLIVPRLRVRRDWFKGLNPDPVDHSHPDVGADIDDSGVGERANAGDLGASVQRRRLLQQDGGIVDANNVEAIHAQATVQASGELTEAAAESFTELFSGDAATVGGHQEGKAIDGQGEEISVDEEEWINEDLAEDLVEDDDAQVPELANDDDPGHIPHGADVRTVRYGNRGRQERPPFHADLEGGDVYNQRGVAADQDYGFLPPDIPITNEDWEDDLHIVPDRSPEEYVSPYVYIDAHLLANPAIEDIDGDGREELVLSVSYFFDTAEIAANSGAADLAVGKGGDPGNYVASGVVVFDLHSRAIKWSQHLDLSTRYTRYRAEAHAPPTLADIDRDGRLEVIVGTSMGWVYVLDPKTGSALEGWPVQMGSVEAQVAVADVDADGWLEVIAADIRGSIAVLRVSGKEVWERHLGSAVGAGATVGDVDGDGDLEVVAPTFDGRIYVLDGATGQDKPNFPFRTFGRVAAPVLITKLDDSQRLGMQLVATAYDGFLYVIDALTGCADSLDLGEPSHAMVLADDIAGTGHLDLLVATTGGNVYAIRTASKFQPLKAWPAQVPGTGTAGFTARWNWEGIYATALSRVPRDVRGEAVPVRFTIIDKRPALPGGKQHGPYKVSVTLQGVGVKEMGSGDQPVIGMSDLVNITGTYTLEVPCPRTRTSATIRIEMKDEDGAVFADEFALSFHMHFYRLLKWLVVGPFAFTAAAILIYNGGDSLRAQLPS